LRRIIKRTSPPSATEFDDKTGDNALCAAAFGLDLAALKYLLWEVGIPAKNSKKRTPFHCLAFMFTMSEASSKSLLFSMLKGVDSWLTPLVESAMPKFSDSIRSMDIVETLGPMTVKVAEWLFAAGFSVDVATSSEGITPLQLAAVGGMSPLIKFLLQHGADPNSVTKEKTTPLMFALAHGHCEAAAVLVKHGADLDHRDIRGVSSRDLIEVSGPVSASDALKYFNITQAPVRTIERPLHPTYPSWAPAAARNNGGWDTTRLKGYEEDMHCDVDQYELEEISGVDIFEKYLARQRPILLRAKNTFAAKWPALERYSRASLLKEHGDDVVTASSIPYADKFGGSTLETLTIAEYINEMSLHNITGGEHPWYIFQGNPIAKVNDDKNHKSVVEFGLIPTPPAVSQLFTYIGQGKNYDRQAAHAASENQEVSRVRKEFINAQWALGGAGSGAPVHFHNAAWNALVYGSKKWFLYPPHDMIMSNTQILEFVEKDLEKFATRRSFNPVKPLTCVQTSGDILIVPENWGHGVLNIQDSIAVATEGKHGMWRIKQSLPYIKTLTDLSPNRKPPRHEKHESPPK